MRRGRLPAQELRAAIDRLPLEVREAILAGIKRKRIIAGAHADGAGGVCPMVAADVQWRQVARADVAQAQDAARAWDAYSQATRGWHPATKRQLVALRAMLEASILADSTAADMPFSDVIAEHKLAQSRRDAAGPAPARVARLRRRRDTGERDRSGELAGRDGWAWLRPFRNYDDYERAIRSLPDAASEIDRSLPDSATGTDRSLV